MILVLGSAIVTEAFMPRERGKALGVSEGLVLIGIVVVQPSEECFWKISPCAQFFT